MAGTDGNSMEQFFAEDLKGQIVYGHRRRNPDNTRICYLYDLEIVPEHQCGGPMARSVIVLPVDLADGARASTPESQPSGYRGFECGEK